MLFLEKFYKKYFIHTILAIFIFVIAFADISFAKIKFIIVFRQDCIVWVEEENGAAHCFPCSLNKTRTVLGDFRTTDMYRWRKLYPDSKGKVHYGQYAIRFYKDILFHSVLYNEKDNPLSLDVESYNGINDGVKSQGCVRLRVGDAKWLYENVVYGTKVLVVDNRSEVEKPTFDYIDEDSLYDPTDEEARELYEKKKSEEQNEDDNTDKNLDDDNNEENINEQQNTTSKIIYHTQNNEY